MTRDFEDVGCVAIGCLWILGVLISLATSAVIIWLLVQLGRYIGSLI